MSRHIQTELTIIFQVARPGIHQCHLGCLSREGGISLAFIQPGIPQQNAYIERYNRTVRYDWLAQYLFDSIEEVQEYATQWLWIYNHERPNMALGGITTQQKLGVVA